MTSFRHVVAVITALSLGGCIGGAASDDPKQLARFKATYEQLHARLEKAAAMEPLVAKAFADRGQVILAIRSSLIEKIGAKLAQQYLDEVTVDLRNVSGHSTGEIRRDTFLGNVKVGSWEIQVDLGNLVGRLRAGSPRVGLRAPDLIDVDLPVDVSESLGEATLHFSWHSDGLANAICRDFDIARTIQGRVLPQTRHLSGTFRLQNTGERVTATPLVPDRRVQLRLDLAPKSWDVVRDALQSQNSFGKCGMLIKPEQGVLLLKELAERGIKVRLPRSIFRAVVVPARFQQSVEVNDRSVALHLSAESLRIETATLWTSASVQVQSQPGATPRD